jgi:hypothetical protein
MNLPQLRPLTFGEILDGTFALYRRHFLDYVLTALIPTVPTIVAWIALWLLLPKTQEGVDALSTAQLFLVPYSVVASLLIWGGITHMAAGAYAGERITWQQGLAAAWRRLLPLLGAVLLTAAAVMVGLVLLVIPGILLFLMFFAIIPVVMLERRGPIEAMGRSRQLARAAWGRIFGVLLILVLIILIPSLAFGVAAGAMGMMDGAESGFAEGLGLGFVLMQLVSTLISALVTPLVPIGVLLLYYDRRVRAEGLDLEIATQRLATEG